MTAARRTPSRSLSATGTCTAPQLYALNSKAGAICLTKRTEALVRAGRVESVVKAANFRPVGVEELAAGLFAALVGVGTLAVALGRWTIRHASRIHFSP